MKNELALVKVCLCFSSSSRHCSGPLVDLQEARLFEIKGILSPHFLVYGTSNAQGTREIGTAKRIGVGEYEVPRPLLSLVSPCLSFTSMLQRRKAPTT